MAAIVKSGLHRNACKVIIRMQQQILRLIQTDIRDVFLAGAAIIFPEPLGKMGITHMAHVSQFFCLQRFCRMKINIFKNV